MRSNYLKATLEAAILAVTVLLLTAGVSSAQNVVNLTAAQQSTTLPDGNTVPMWGWTCGGVPGNPVTAAATGTGVTCTSLTYNTTAVAHNAQTSIAMWQPPLIVVPYVATGTGLTINLTNTLPVETSLVIIGQSGGGLGAPVREAAARADGAHAGQTATTWTQVLPAPSGLFTPPTQGERARTFTSIEVAGVATVGGTVATAGAYTYANLQPGTYLIRTGTYPSIQGPMGLYGVLVVTVAPGSGAAGLAYPVPAGQVATGVHYDADVVALESEIDARQNKMVAALFPTGGTMGSSTANTGFIETMKWTPACGAATNSTLTATGAVPTCYPPAVDYTPTYFLINGLAFSKDNRAASALSVPAAASTGNVLVRYVNAGSHMHTPTVDGLNMLLVAEDGYVLPDIALAITGGKSLTANPPSGAACTTTSTTACGLRIQDEVFQAAGKVFDVIVSPPKTGAAFTSGTYPTWDRSLALGTNSQRDGGMQAILDVNDAAAAKLPAVGATVVADHYAYAPGVTLKVTDPGKGVIANDTNVYGVQLSTAATGGILSTSVTSANGTLTLYPNGTLTYVPTGTGTDTFNYCANGNNTLCTTITLNMSATANAAHAPTANPDTFTSPSASLMRVAAPGVLLNDTDPDSFPLTAVIGTPTGVTVNLGADGSFTAVPTTAGACGPLAPCTFTYQAKNSQGISSLSATATLIFQPGSGLKVRVQDAATNAAITDYKWIIEQDLTLHIDPACQVNTGSATIRPTGSNGLPCPALPGTSVAPPTPATQFHASFYPVIATGCTGPQSCGQGQTVYDAGTPCTGTLTPPACSTTAGQHVLAACDGYGICTIGASQLPASLPSDAHLTATNPDGTPATYYISILSGDSTNAFNTGNVTDPTIAGNCAGGTEPTGITISSKCGHTMGGSPVPAGVCTGTVGTTSYTCTYPAPVAPAVANVTVNLELEPLKTATVTAFIFEDDYPLNGEPDTGGGVDSLATLEVPLGDFQFEIWDDAGGIGDFTGQMTYDTFNVPLTNALNGTMDPATGNDACPISNTNPSGATPGVGIGVIVVCPQLESDGVTPSPLTGQAVVKNLMQGKYSLIAHPGANREAAGEEWLQTNSLDGGHFLDSFIRVGEPPYFAEFGPGGYHVFMGMANPAHINARLASICGGTPLPNVPFTPPCRNNINGQITNLHQGRSPNEDLSPANVFPQGDPRNYAPLTYTNCYAAIGDSDGATIALAKCDPDGNFKFTGLPDGNYGIVIFDQWDDFIVDGSSRPVNISGGATQNLTFPTFTWQTHLWSRAYMDVGGLGAPVLLSDGTLDPIASPGLIQVPTKIRQRNGKFVNTLLSDIGGNARFDETFPLFAFYTVESDDTRFRTTGVHVVNDAGGPVDTTGPYAATLNSKESFPLPAALRYPGSVYCATAACTGGFAVGSSSTPSTGRIDPGSSVQGNNAYINTIEGWQGGVSEFDMIDWGKTPYIPGENGGISGRVVYTSTRPFDDPRMNFQNLWDPLVPNVTINLYQEGTAPDGSTSLTLVDTTQTSSWDAWAQGFHTVGTASMPNMSCTGQDPTDPFFSYTLAGTTNYLYPNTALPNNSQYKCYDGYHNLNQLQPAPYDGKYQFPSQACLTVGATFTIPGNTTAYHCATIPNPAAGQAGAATAILPPGKYVTEVVVPPNWELNKEEDLNLLIGDQYIAPAATQFAAAGLGNIFITPDQASIDAANPSYTGPYTPSSGYTPPFSGCTTPGVASTCTFTPNSTNNGKQAGDYGRTTFGSFGPGGVIQQSAPCVGLLRIVPDYLSISPESGEVAPFAGVSKNLCDRKEITLDDQMQADADFFIWTKVAKAVTFTGFISDDFSSEFDPASPAFGEKFAIPNVPVSIKDFNGVEVSRLYSDQWGTFNGLVYGSWEVNVPNITGYSPNMMVTCMNDAGPIADPAHPGQLINDPYYTPAYSTFCYENPFMPGDATYLDTPVVPVSAFAEGYNPPDCAYPDGTPMIKSVTGDAIALTTGRGPWVSAAGTGHILTITAAGDASGNIVVPNNAYSGPAANTAPYNLKTVTRHVGFGTSAGSVTIGGVTAACTWGDLSMTCTVPTGVPACPLLQTNDATGAKYPAQCGQLVITTANTATGGAPSNAKQSIDTVTVTIGGKAPTYVAGENATNNAIQKAIDSAHPGDLIIVGCALAAGTTPAQTACTYNELVLMWKPVRLQGIGDGAVTINANVHPAGKLLEPWRRQVNCLFGLALNGGYISSGNAYDPNNVFTCTAQMQGAVDPILGEPVVGWDATLNGNIAELLQEPTLMGAYEGAGITVLARGLENNNTVNCTPEGTAGCLPLNSSTATGGDCNRFSQFYPSNYLCNPSRIDGLTITNASQGGGGIFAHGWTHNLEVANNHVFGNGGTLTGGITIGQMETVDPTLVTVGSASVAQPLLQTANAYVHNNSVTFNAAYGDELNSNTPASAGGVTFCTGSDYYRFQYNWICGNLSTGDGGGFAHHGFIWNGDIEHNAFVFNQSINPTLTTYGGGAIVEGAAPDGTLGELGLTGDIDVAPALSDGIGPGLVVNANLFQGNTAEEGSGGGLMLMHVNGNDVLNNPSDNTQWYGVSITNNIFGNNVAGWTGGGVALFDAVKVDFRNNTVVSNDSTATAGVLFDSLGAPNANHAPPGCDPNAVPPPAACSNTSVTTSNFQPAGLATELHSSNLLPAFTNPNVTCPAGNDTVPPTHACTHYSVPAIANDIFWQNRAFHITTNAGIVQLTPALNQSATGGCPTGANYWDIGAYNDTGPSNHASGVILHPTYSILDDPADYAGANNLAGSSTTVATQYCDGSRVPAEIAPALCGGAQGNANAPGCIQPGTLGVGTTVPGGVADSLVPPLPLFTLTPAATVDEGSNWINMFYGPLSLTNPTIQAGGAGYGVMLGNYAPGAGSPALGAVPSSQFHPTFDFFGNLRPDPTDTTHFDIGAVEIGSVPAAVVGFSGPSPALTTGTANTTTKNGVITVTNSGTLNLNLTANPTIAKTAGLGTFSIQPGGTCVSGAVVASGGGTCTINVRYVPSGTATSTANVTLTDTGAQTASQTSANFNGN